MVCPNCGAEQAEGNIECIRCGIIFQKIHSHPVVPPQPSVKDKMDEDERFPLGEQIKELLFSVGISPNPLALAGRSLLLVILFVWGLKFFVHPISDNYTGESFLHLVNLPFHEAGHIFFGLFGEFIAALGGSLGQLLMPLICLFSFLIRMRDPFAASVAFWWFGESLMDMAPYINDARDLNLILLGGNTGKDSPGIHDWEYILGTLNLLPYEHFLARVVNGLGMASMVAAYLWGGYLLYKGFRALRADEGMEA
jgi:hypothetical protein